MIKDLYNKYKSIVMYLIFGVATTLVNIVSYYLLAHIVKLSIMSSTIIAWVLAVLFAYFTNRKWVFDSEVTTRQGIIKEMISFFMCRLATGIVDWVIMFIFVENIGLNDVLIKTIANIVVIVLNYVASKLIVFRKKDNKFNVSLSKSSIIIGIVFFIATFVFLLKSPLHLWTGSEAGIDSSVFKMIAIMMRNGYVPYLNLFDHKGPLIYIINYTGTFISPYRGVWVIEFVSLYVTMCYLYKIARLRCNKYISCFISILSITLLFEYFNGGNFTEEYALPFIAISLYIFLDYIYNGKITKLRLILCGLSFGAVLMLRPNMVVTWFVFSLYILLKKLIKKEYKELWLFIRYFLLGSLILIAPIMVWLSIKGALYDFYNQYIVFNLAYADNGNYATCFLDKISHIWRALLTFVNNPLVIASIILSMCFIRRDKKYIIYFIYLCMTLCLVSMSGRVYEHYMMIFVPTIVFPFADLFKCCADLDKKNNIFSILIVLYLVTEIVFPKWFVLVKEIPNTYWKRNENHVARELRTISKEIKSRTDENDRISVYGNFDIIYILSNRLHATEYSYQFPIIHVFDDIEKNYFQQLYEEQPKIIVVNFEDNRIHDFLDKNDYHFIRTVIFQKRTFSIYEKKM